MRGAPATGGLLAVRVVPGASREGLAGWHGASLRVRVTAPPEGGRANEAVRALLARELGVPPSQVVLVRGGASRDKLFRVATLSGEAVRARLGAAAASARKPGAPA